MDTGNMGNIESSAIRRCGEWCPINRMLEGQPDEVCLDPNSSVYLLAQCALVGVEAAEKQMLTFRNSTPPQIEEAVHEAIFTEVGIAAREESQLIVSCVLNARDPQSGCKLSSSNVASPVQPTAHHPAESGTPVPTRHALVKRWTHWPWA